jgi:hypothetical protein
VKEPILNQVRIAVIVSQSLLKKSVANGDLPASEAETIMYHLTRSLELVKEHLPRKTDQ